MASILKRKPVEFPKIPDNPAKLFNQLDFKGIVQSNNPFAADQHTFKATKNVYVDKNQVLISRPPLAIQVLPNGYFRDGVGTIMAPVLPLTHSLVDIVTIGTIRLYVGLDSMSQYKIVALDTETKKAAEIPFNVNKYHISAVNQYIIVFNDIDAMVLNTYDIISGWQSIRDYVNVPVTRRYINQQSFTSPGNQFTESYKEEYVWSEDTLTILPDGDADVLIQDQPNPMTWHLENANINTEFRLLRKLNITLSPTDIVTTALNKNTGTIIICIATDKGYVLISTDGGYTFKRVLYPEHQGYLRIASVSKDGLNFCFVARDGVYVYQLEPAQWKYVVKLKRKNPGTNEVEPIDIDGVAVGNICHFDNAEVFSFILYEASPMSFTKAYLYYKGQGLLGADEEYDSLGRYVIENVPWDSRANMAGVDGVPYYLNMDVVPDIDNSQLRVTNIVASLPSNNTNKTVLQILLGRSSSGTIQPLELSFDLDYSQLLIESFENTSIELYTVRGKVADNQEWKEIELTFTKVDQTWEVDVIRLDNLNLAVSTDESPLSLRTANLAGLSIISVDGLTQLQLLDKPRTQSLVLNNMLLIRTEDTIYTNWLTSSNHTTLTYNYLSDAAYNKVPTFSYTNNELYLCFGKELKITDNFAGNQTSGFNLPEINNHAFVTDVTNMINVSTAEIAIFLRDRIFLSVQTPDETFGFRYDYRNTKFAVGVRLGDNAINTTDGKYTLFATAYGLAVMAYQENVAATDQIIEYASKQITNIWEDFYKLGPAITLLQLDDYIWLTNGTTKYLLLDLRDFSWWELESPFPITKLFTDKFDLFIISSALYKFDNNYHIYKDVGTRQIDWSIESQPLHFNALSSYTNIKQLIFKFKESTSNEHTISIQIKLYRKQSFTKEPEIIRFRAEGYRTFIKRFNYWQVNELQWALAADHETYTPAQLQLNGVSIKYERGDEIKS